MWQRCIDTNENHFLNGQNYPPPKYPSLRHAGVNSKFLDQEMPPPSLKTSNRRPQSTVSLCLCRSYIVINMCSKPTKFIKVTQTQYVVC